MRICLVVGGYGSGKTSFLNSLIEYEQRMEGMTRAIINQIFSRNIEINLDSIFFRLEDDETRIKKIEKEFFADIQKLYGDYRRYGIDVNTQLVHKYKDYREQFEHRTIQRFELNELHNQFQECRSIFAKVNRYRFHMILDRILRSKGEVRQKPPLINSLKFVFILIENQFIVLQRFFDMRWREFNNLKMTSIFQQVSIGKERFILSAMIK